MRVTPVTVPAVEIVAVAVGSVVQPPTAPCVTVTSGADVYPAPPPLVGITAAVPVAFAIAVAAVPPVALKAILTTSFFDASMVAIATGGVAQVKPVVFTVTVGFEV